MGKQNHLQAKKVYSFICSDHFLSSHFFPFLYLSKRISQYKNNGKKLIVCVLWQASVHSRIPYAFHMLVFWVLITKVHNWFSTCYQRGFRSVVVITSASHAEGRQFNSGRKQHSHFLFLNVLFLRKTKMFWHSQQQVKITVRYVLLLFPNGKNISFSELVSRSCRSSILKVYLDPKAWLLWSSNDFQFVYHKWEQFWRR